MVAIKAIPHIGNAPLCRLNKNPITVGTKAAAEDVVLANAKRIISKAAIMGTIINNGGKCSRCKLPNETSASQRAASVCNNTFPKEIPAPKSKIVPASTRLHKSFQLPIPTPGNNMARTDKMDTVLASI